MLCILTSILNHSILYFGKKRVLYFSLVEAQWLSRSESVVFPLMMLRVPLNSLSHPPIPPSSCQIHNECVYIKSVNLYSLFSFTLFMMVSLRISNTYSFSINLLFHTYSIEDVYKDRFIWIISRKKEFS